MNLYLSHGCVICTVQDFIKTDDKSDIFDGITEVVGYSDELSENDLCRFFQPIGSQFKNCSEMLRHYEC